MTSICRRVTLETHANEISRAGRGQQLTCCPRPRCDTRGNVCIRERELDREPNSLSCRVAGRPSAHLKMRWTCRLLQGTCPSTRTYLARHAFNRLDQRDDRRGRRARLMPPRPRGKTARHQPCLCQRAPHGRPARHGRRRRAPTRAAAPRGEAAYVAQGRSGLFGRESVRQAPSRKAMESMTAPLVRREPKVASEEATPAISRRT